MVETSPIRGVGFHLWLAITKVTIINDSHGLTIPSIRDHITFYLIPQQGGKILSHVYTEEAICGPTDHAY